MHHLHCTFLHIHSILYCILKNLCRIFHQAPTWERRNFCAKLASGYWYPIFVFSEYLWNSSLDRGDEELKILNQFPCLFWLLGLIHLQIFAENQKQFKKGHLLRHNEILSGVKGGRVNGQSASSLGAARSVTPAKMLLVLMYVGIIWRVSENNSQNFVASNTILFRRHQKRSDGRCSRFQ